jgi:hypothetical protein
LRNRVSRAGQSYCRMKGLDDRASHRVHLTAHSLVVETGQC